MAPARTSKLSRRLSRYDPTTFSPPTDPPLGITHNYQWALLCLPEQVPSTHWSTDADGTTSQSSTSSTPPPTSDVFTTFTAKSVLPKYPPLYPSPRLPVSSLQELQRSKGYQFRRVNIKANDWEIWKPQASLRKKEIKGQDRRHSNTKAIDEVVIIEEVDDNVNVDMRIGPDDNDGEDRSMELEGFRSRWTRPGTPAPGRDADSEAGWEGGGEESEGEEIEEGEGEKVPARTTLVAPVPPTATRRSKAPPLKDETSTRMCGFNMRIRGTGTQTRWTRSQSKNLLDFPTPEEYDHQLGDIHYHRAGPKFQYWVWDKQATGGEGWVLSLIGRKHPTCEHRLAHLFPGAPPSWVSRKTLSTYWSKLPKNWGSIPLPPRHSSVY